MNLAWGPSAGHPRDSHRQRRAHPPRGARTPAIGPAGRHLLQPPRATTAAATISFRCWVSRGLEKGTARRKGAAERRRLHRCRRTSRTLPVCPCVAPLGSKKATQRASELGFGEKPGAGGFYTSDPRAPPSDRDGRRSDGARQPDQNEPRREEVLGLFAPASPGCGPQRACATACRWARLRTGIWAARRQPEKEKKKKRQPWALRVAGLQLAVGRMAGRGPFKYSDSFYILFYFQKHLNNCFAQF